METKFYTFKWKKCDIEQALLQAQVWASELFQHVRKIEMHSLFWEDGDFHHTFTITGNLKTAA